MVMRIVVVVMVVIIVDFISCLEDGRLLGVGV